MTEPQDDPDPLLDDETEIMVGDRVYRVTIREIDGAWFVTSRRTKGLCAAHKSLIVAMREARLQIKELAELKP
jgi:nitrogen fixation protein FixH